ncbi:MAG: HAMP domain-containing sensor histidine kinase [Actinomycetota bacterium]|nr:HAMP domain-containing sensor histidine kinase [Actinomycetota bacterium]
MNQRDALVSSLDTALLVALAATLVCSTAIAIVMSRRSVRSLDRLRAGTRTLAAGDYRTRVAPPPEPELADLAHDINRLAERLAETEQRRAALIGDVAHEMRTPLTTINGYLEGFDDGLFTSRELTDTVRTEVVRLSHLAGDLAAVSRSEEGRLELERSACDLRDAVTIVVDRLRPQFEAAGVDLVVAAPHPLPALVDLERMVQVLSNVVGNALAYTPAGGRVSIDGAAADGLRITVTDTGRGLAADDLERVFERFYRADPSDHSGGTGVGLTISRAIVRAHGGDLVARSPGAGRGSTFEITLPNGA